MDYLVLALNEAPEYLEDCIDFVSAHFGNREYFDKILAECVQCDTNLPQGYVLIKREKL